jgi:type IV pilus assembly protein PilY1
MNFTKTISALTLCATMGCFPASHAEDTDLFMNPQFEKTSLPNVLFIVDNSANWTREDDNVKNFDFVQQALSSVFSNLDTSKYNVGFMIAAETGESLPKGGYVRFAISEMDEANKNKLNQEILNLDIQKDNSSQSMFAPMLHEAYLYFEGKEAYAGYNKTNRDENAFETATKYKTPKTDPCAKNFIIFLSNGAPSQGENAIAEGDLIKTLEGFAAPDDPIDLTPSTYQNNYADEYARYLSAKGVYTYTIDVRPEGKYVTDNKTDETEYVYTNQALGNTALLNSMAVAGKGTYTEVMDTASLILAIDDVLKEIQAVDSVFAATALPVSVNVRGTYLNEVYMAVFRPDENAAPRWHGNLKLYQLAVESSTGEVFLADKNGNKALNDAEGFIKPTAVSFWTTPSDYWDLLPRGTPPSGSDSPDGEIVEKGGSAQQQRTNWTDVASRTLYTCTTCANGSLLSSTPFNNTNVSAEDLGYTADQTAERDLLIDWIRGEDNTVPPERTSDLVRPSIHGDVVHSRPAIVNYNRTGDDSDIVVFYGANDGVFRAIVGGKANADGGEELWGFVAPEHFGALNRLRENNPKINTPAIVGDANNKPYFMDGSVSVYTYDKDGDGKLSAGDGDKVYAYVTMRRGGRFIYAFDVSTPETPRLLWKKSSSDSGYGELGQTWSEARPATIKLGGVSKAVLIMGAGYDAAAEDTLPAGTTTMGRGIFVIDAEDGKILWSVGPDEGFAHSVAADVTVIDRNGDDFMDRVYAVDTGANIWRLDIGDSDETKWKATKIAALGGSDSNARKFLFPPDVVYGSDANGPYDAVLVGSGDRENPFDITVTNRFYMIKDRYIAPITDETVEVITEDNLYDATANLIQTGDAETQAAEATKLLDAKGWYITLTGKGEKTVGSAVSIAGTVFFSTNQIDDEKEECGSNLGTALIYGVSYKDATATINFDGIGDVERTMEVPGGGYPPPPTPVVVEIDGEKEQTVCFGPNCVSPPNVELEKRKRVFWHKLID